jgi:transcriptional regulator with XRE-family HTH domain
MNNLDFDKNKKSFPPPPPPPTIHDENDCKILLSRNIRFFRNRLGISQTNLACELGISNSFMNDIETGKKWLSHQTLTKIAKILKIEVYELFKPEQHMKEDIAETFKMYLYNLDTVLIEAIEKSVTSAVRKIYHEKETQALSTQ